MLIAKAIFYVTERVFDQEYVSRWSHLHTIRHDFEAII